MKQAVYCDRLALSETCRVPAVEDVDANVTVIAVTAPQALLVIPVEGLACWSSV
jgi:hypothetical protein